MAGRLGRDAPGIVALVGLIDAHRGAFEYDWRARFHLPLAAIGEAMTLGEAVRLTAQLALDSESHVAAAMSEWEHPMPRAAIVLMDLYDLQHQSKAKRKPKPYPRPWSLTERKSFARTRLSRHRLRQILRAHRADDDQIGDTRG